MADQQRFVDPESLVYCAVRRRPVDIERCLECRRLVDLDLDARRPFIVCRGPEEQPPAEA